MQTFVALLIFTLSYGLLFLSMYPVKRSEKFNQFTSSAKNVIYRKYDLTWPYFISFLGGYLLASAMVYLIQDSL
ncbi:hypothetical protein [Cyclobacterium jeungdonense]|uniref:Uncharacterized protein n=1 Tax=Cyclobacterium jeungdonense TaxID=708087 RepID=A0ABT8CAV7_9BACT|nr:hypothetical protein [Cyclobacterium jeungdonense]MDN3689919.1 hypothetical protein [Cyclobacterium jeungdonense]